MNLYDYPDSSTDERDEVKVPFYKLNSGQNVVRLVPDLDGEMMVPYKLHWVANNEGDKFPHRCTNFNSKTGKFDVSNKTCQYCKAKIPVQNGDISTVITPEGAVNLFPMKPTIREKIVEKIEDLISMDKISSPEDINSPTNGVWLTVTKTGIKLNTKYSVTISKNKNLPADITELLEAAELPTLSQLYPKEDTDKQLEVITNGGSTPTPTASNNGNGTSVEDLDANSPVEDDDIPF